MYRKSSSVPAEDIIIAQALSILENRVFYGQQVSSSRSVKEYLMLKLGGCDREQFTMLLLNNRNQIMHCEILFQGTLSHCEVHPREVMKCVLEHNAAAVIFAHNHPAGDPTPSEADKTLTYKLREALAIVDVRVLDHIVVGGGHAIAAAEQGWL